MRTSSFSSQQSNVLGALWMVLAMVLFAVEDALLKLAAQSLPTGQMLLLFGLGGALVFAAFLLLSDQRLYHPDVLSRPMRLRVFFEVFGRLFYILALALTPLSTTTVILQATPLVVVATAALLFGEVVGWRRWTAIAIGLAGVIIIIRPTGDSFSPLSLLAVLGMLGFAGRDLASRAAPPSITTNMLGLYGMLSVVAAGGGYALWQQIPLVWPDRDTSLILLGAVFVGVFAYRALMSAMRTGEVSAVTPFRYSRLIFGLALGVLLFGERIDRYMLIGSGFIVLSGLFILWRGRQRRP